MLSNEDRHRTRFAALARYEAKFGCFASRCIKVLDKKEKNGSVSLHNGDCTQRRDIGCSAEAKRQRERTRRYTQRGKERVKDRNVDRMKTSVCTSWLPRCVRQDAAASRSPAQALSMRNKRPSAALRSVVSSASGVVSHSTRSQAVTYSTQCVRESAYSITVCGSAHHLLCCGLRYSRRAEQAYVTICRMTRSQCPPHTDLV